MKRSLISNGSQDVGFGTHILIQLATEDLVLARLKVEYSHRAAWIVYNGPIPEGLHVLHKCDVQLCVNPSHLFLGTHQENMTDRDRKRRGNREPVSHCVHGHEFTDDNTYIYVNLNGKTSRYCRICSSIKSYEVRHGLRKSKLTPKERFDQKWGLDSNGCWIWNRPIPQNGYGQFYLDTGRGSLSAHRASWIIHYGEIPEGLLVLHECDVMTCVNPEHLFLGTHAQNMSDMAAKGRAKNGHIKRKNGVLT